MSSSGTEEKTSFLPKGEKSLLEASHPSSSSAQPPPYQHARANSKFAIISFHMLDRLRLLGFDESEILQIRQLVATLHPDGIQDTRTYNESFELKLKGTPWMWDVLSPDPALKAYAEKNHKVRKLTQGLVSGLYDMGWEFEQSVLVSKKAAAKDSLLFRRAERLLPPCDWMTIAFDLVNHLTLFGAPPELFSQMNNTFIARGWATEGAMFENRHEIRTSSHVWMGEGEVTVVARLMLLTLAEVLDQFGFRVYATVKLASACDVLICQRERQNVIDA